MHHPRRQRPLNFCLVPRCSAVRGQPWARDPRDAGQPQFRGAEGEKGPGPLPAFWGNSDDMWSQGTEPQLHAALGGSGWEGSSPLTHACTPLVHLTHSDILSRACSRARAHVWRCSHSHTLIHTHAVHTHSHPYLLTHTHTLTDTHSHSPMLITHSHTHTHTHNTHKHQAGRGITV